MKKNQIAIILKDINSIFSDKKTLATIFFLPTLSIIAYPYWLLMEINSGIVGKNTSYVNNIIGNLTVVKTFSNQAEKIFYYGVTESSILFYVIILMVVSMMISVGSFIIEKEKKTMETLLYTPITIKEIFVAKIGAVFGISMLLNIILGLLYWVIVAISSYTNFQYIIFPSLKWIILYMVFCPAILLGLIFFIVLVSLKSKSYNEAYQKSSMAILPIIVLIFAQVFGVITIDTLSLTIGSLIILIIDFILIKISLKNVKYENLI